MEEQVTKLEPETTDDYGSKYAISRRELLELWHKGILTAPAYVYLAAMLDGIHTGEKFDMGAFCARWTYRADPSSEVREKDKPLKRSHVVNAIAKFDEKELGTLPKFDGLTIWGA